MYGANPAIPEPFNLSSVNEMVFFYITSLIIRKTADRYKWKVCDRLLWAVEKPDEALGHLINVKNIGGLRLPSPAMFSLAIIVFIVFSNMKKLNLFNVGTGDSLVALMIKNTERRLQF